MPNTATRLITLIMLLQRRPNQKAAELASQLGVSVRTVQRYIAMLDEMGIPIYSERGPYGGYSLVRGYKMLPYGSVIVTFAAPDLEWPARVALGYGPHAVVLELEELRCLVSERARVIAAQYASAG